MKQIKVNLRTIFLAKQLHEYENNGDKVYLKDINLNEYADDEKTLAYYSAKYLHVKPEIGIPLLWGALHQQFDF